MFSNVMTSSIGDDIFRFVYVYFESILENKYLIVSRFVFDLTIYKEEAMDEESKRLLKEFDKEIEQDIPEPKSELVEEADEVQEQPPIVVEEPMVDWQAKYEKLLATNTRLHGEMKTMIGMCDYMGKAVEKLGLHFSFD
jgi:hypothetical protein